MDFRDFFALSLIRIRPDGDPASARPNPTTRFLELLVESLLFLLNRWTS